MNIDPFEGPGEGISLMSLNRRQRRQFRRAILGEHRRTTRFWRRAWRGVMPQWQIAAIVRSTQKTSERMDAKYGVGNAPA